MGRLFSKFLRPPRRPLPRRSCPLATPARDTARPGRTTCGSCTRPLLWAQAIPAGAEGEPVPARCHGEPRRRLPLPQAAGPPLGLLPAGSWGSPPGGVSCLRSCPLVRPSRTVRIPPPGREVTLLHSLPAQGAGAAGQVPTRPLPLSSPRGTEEEVPEHPGGQTQALGETKGPGGGSGRPHSRGARSGHPSPGHQRRSQPPPSQPCSPGPTSRPLRRGLVGQHPDVSHVVLCRPRGHLFRRSRGRGPRDPDRDARCPRAHAQAAPGRRGPPQRGRRLKTIRPGACGPRGGGTHRLGAPGVSPRSPLPPASASSGPHRRKLGLPPACQCRRLYHCCGIGGTGPHPEASSPCS
ncbi:LOW QUALITY PROTEIN: nuclear pore-associated protein 1-like [Canis lupus familiaris]|uniref:LOW QUALITY PROTEIN: nuclear pore-associated protein 1-like n=1 Tax=Canis lupus familiaris TaxID=9615 RepID=UPI0018F62112|nr:LOW QUALITY PROTEIN: nuclear pore-associated protein 1-like [Canis lupus familiaris]